MDDELARCKDMASRAREMARQAYNEGVRMTLTGIAEDYERFAAEIEAQRDPDGNQAD